MVKKQEEHSCCGVVEEAAYQAREKSEARRSKPQSWIVLKMTVGFTLGIMAYTAYVYIHRFTIPMMLGDANALGSLRAGVVLLVFFALLWLWMVWAYIRIVITSPGKAKDYVPESPEPILQYADPSAPGTPNMNLPATLEPTSTAPGTMEKDMDRIGGPSYEQQKAAPHSRTFTRAAPNTLSVPTDPSTSSQATTHENREPDRYGNPARDSTLAPFSAEYASPDMKKLSMASDSTAPTKPFPGSAKDRKTLKEEKEMQRAMHIGRRPPPVPYLREEQRYCTRCRIVKPYRAHHCRACGTCILRYDHHCPWIGQCVGAQNYKFFFNFCEAAWAFTTYTFATLVGFVASHADIDIDAQIIVIIALSALFMSFTAALVIAHARQIMIGQTTVELMHIRGLKERDSAMLARVFSLWEMGAKKRTRARWDAEWGSPDREGNLWWQGSTRAEWVSVMGESWIGWIFPIGRGPSNGMDYVPNPRFDSEGRPRPREQWPEELR